MQPVYSKYNGSVSEKRLLTQNMNSFTHCLRLVHTGSNFYIYTSDIEPDVFLIKFTELIENAIIYTIRHWFANFKNIGFFLPNSAYSVHYLDLGYISKCHHYIIRAEK